ncbi:MAG TPA: hypothetical protein VKY59_07005 [Spirillospora sp.]|nr:hypothetical protein [Spirillospora sp.]
MTDQITPSQTRTTDNPQHSILWLAAAALLVSFGLTMFLFSAAYIKDVQLLSKAPEMVWAFICGNPGDYGVTLPLLLTIGTLGLFGGIAAGLVGWWRSRSRSRPGKPQV